MGSSDKHSAPVMAEDAATGTGNHGETGAPGGPNSGSSEAPTPVDDPPIEEGLGDGLAWSMGNWLVIGLFTLLVLVGVWITTGWYRPAVAAPASNPETTLVTVPLYIYLYAGFGALGYIFTKLMVQLDRFTEWGELEQLAELAMRIPAAWILAAGIYLFLGDVGQTAGTSGARFAAAVAFLVGLYVNVAMKALGSLADRILGRGPTR